MALPMVTVTGHYETANGSPETGTVTFTPSVPLSSSSNSIIIQPGPVIATLDGTGAFTVSLLATDAAGVVPTGWTYQVTERLGSQLAPVGRVYNILLPQAQSPVDLSAINPVSVTGVVSQFAPISVVRSITASTVTANPFDVLECNATTQPITVTLPANSAGTQVTVKKMDSSANAVTVTGTVDGVSNPTLTFVNQSMELVADGANWIRVVRPAVGALVDYPATTDARYVRPSQVPPVTIVAAATGVQATDATNIGAAITTAGANGSLYFPFGTYVADNLTPLSGQTWYGPATIQRPASSTNAVITATGLTGFTMRDLTVDGNRSNSSTNTAAVYLIQSTWCRITGITVQNCPSAGAAIMLRGAVRCIVADCQISNVGYAIMLGMSAGDAYSCYGNEVRGCTIDTTDNDAIFLTENFGSTAGTVVGRVVGNVVSGCVVRNPGDSGIEIGSGCVNCEVSGSTFIGLSNGVGNCGILFRDAVNSSATGCVVSGFTKSGATGVSCFDLNGTVSRISLNGIDVQGCYYGYLIIGGTAGGTLGNAAQDIEINGGLIDSVLSDGIHLNNVKGFGITGTKIRNSGSHGVSVGKFNVSSATDGTITGARIFNSNQNNGGYSGICIFQSSADVSITGCRIGDNQGTHIQAYGIRIFDTTVSNVTISECDLTNGGTTANLSNASTSANIRAFRNLGYNPQGMLNLTALTTSPTTYTAGITPEVLYLNGGSGVSLTKNGLALPYNSATGSTYPLEPGEAIVITWTTTAPNYYRTDRK